MLRHTGPKRTFLHNLRLAVLLSMTAGFVNAAGFVAFAVLTTNITGHAATLAVDGSVGEWRAVQMAVVGLLLFLAGAFFSSWYIGLMGRHKRYVYSVPLLIEMSLLGYVALYGYSYDGSLIQKEHFAGCLLFAMGIQNALVSVVSRSVVRTTHLTGMVTDFGIALAETVRKRFRPGRQLRQRLMLHVNIIFFFLAGGVSGAFAFQVFHYYSFFIPAVLVLFTLFYDAFRVNILIIKHRLFLRLHTRKQRLSKPGTPSAGSDVYPK